MSLGIGHGDGIFFCARMSNLNHSFMRSKMQFMSAQILLASLFSVCLLVGCKDDNDPVSTKKSTYTISGNANGSQMVPSVTGTGTGTISGTYDPNTRVMNYTTNWNGLTGAPMSGGFYNGASGSAGTAVGSPWTIPAGSTESGTMTGTMTLTPEQGTQLTGGNWYYSMGTATNPNGEVRGQITATSGSAQ
jgi:hypothetical protein